MTLDDLERPKSTLAEKKRFTKTTRKINKDVAVVSTEKCSPMILLAEM